MLKGHAEIPGLSHVYRNIIATWFVGDDFGSDDQVLHTLHNYDECEDKQRARMMKQFDAFRPGGPILLPALSNVEYVFLELEFKACELFLLQEHAMHFSSHNQNKSLGYAFPTNFSLRRRLQEVHNNRVCSAPSSLVSIRQRWK